MKLKIIISSIVVIALLAAITFTWHEYSEVASARVKLEKQQNALEKEKVDFKKEQDNHKKEFDKFKSDKEQFEEDKESLASEREEIEKAKLHTTQEASTQSNSDEVPTNEAPLSEPQVTEQSTQTEPQFVEEESQNNEAPQATESGYVPETEPTITEAQEILNQIAEIDLRLTQLGNEKNNYPETSEEYINVVREEIEQMNIKKELLQQLETIQY
jgi:hypothetical protein